MLRRFSRWSCSRRNGHAMVWPLRFPAEPERRRTGRCWVNPDRRDSDRARREDGRSDARRPSHTGQVNEGWLDLFCGGRALRGRTTCRVGRDAPVIVSALH